MKNRILKNLGRAFLQTKFREELKITPTSSSHKPIGLSNLDQTTYSDWEQEKNLPTPSIVDAALSLYWFQPWMIVKPLLVKKLTQLEEKAVNVAVWQLSGLLLNLLTRKGSKDKKLLGKVRQKYFQMKIIFDSLSGFFFKEKKIPPKEHWTKEMCLIDELIKQIRDSERDVDVFQKTLVDKVRKLGINEKIAREIIRDILDILIEIDNKKFSSFSCKNIFLDPLLQDFSILVMEKYGLTTIEKPEDIDWDKIIEESEESTDSLEE